MDNLFERLRPDPEKEISEVFLKLPGIEFERITSLGQASPEGFFYNQDFDEWVCVLKGSAELEIEGRIKVMKEGDWTFLPRGCPHRVTKTDPKAPTLWLAVNIGKKGAP